MSRPPRTPGARSAWAARAALAPAATVLALLWAAGCGFGEGETTSGEATLTVTRDYGAEVLFEADAVDPPATDTVLRFLDRESEIETRFGGRFVQAIDGLSGSESEGRRKDWIFYVNGAWSPVGAAEVPVAAGDRIWWDLHDWTDVPRLTMVVGSWPAPFSSPERDVAAGLDCSAPAEDDCEAVRRSIEGAADRTVVDSSELSGRAAERTPLVLVGPWEALRREPEARALEDAPSRSGVFARFLEEGSGWDVETYDEALAPIRRLGAGTGLIAAVEGAPEQPIWLVTGTDEAGVAAAAEALGSAALANRFAVAIVAGDEVIPLPQR